MFNPRTWTLTHLLQLKQEYDNLQRKCTTVSYRNRMWSKIRQLPLRTLSYCLPSPVFIRSLHVIGSSLIRGESRPLLSPTQRSLSWQIMKTWASWSEVITPSQKSRMLEKLTLRTPLTIDSTKEQDLDPQSSSNIDHPSVLTHEMMTIEPGENPSRNLTWKSTGWISHFMCRSHDDHVPIPVWETWLSPQDLTTSLINAAHTWVVCLQDQLVDSFCWSPCEKFRVSYVKITSTLRNTGRPPFGPHDRL